jgi:ribosomal protein S18 acetylase RimI-like enzyme
MPLSLRPARASDHRAFARLYPELATGDATPDAGRFASELAETTILAEDGGGPVGYAYYQVVGTLGYVRHVVVDRQARRTGVGRALMLRVAERFREAGCTEQALNVKPDNAAAIQLYEGLGFSARYASRALRMPWARVPAESALDELRPSALEPSADLDVEAALGLPRAMLETARAQGGRVLVRVDDGEALVAAGVFDPGFPGIYPLRARSLEAALSLVAACRPHARGHDHVDLVVEDQPALADGLVAHGAETKLDIVHMRAKIVS